MIGLPCDLASHALFAAEVQSAQRTDTTGGVRKSLLTIGFVL